MEKKMNKFNEVYAKIIMEANDFENENSESKIQINRKINKDSFKEFIGRKFITAHCNVDRKKSLKEQKFSILRATIKDINIEKISYNFWKVKAIFDKQGYFIFDTTYLSADKLKDCTPDKFEEMLKKRFSGHVDYSESYPDPHSSIDYPETIDYAAPDNGQSDDEIKKMMIDVAFENLKKEKIKLLKERDRINQKILKFNKFLGEEE